VDAAVSLLDVGFRVPICNKEQLKNNIYIMEEYAILIVSQKEQRGAIKWKNEFYE